VRDLSIRREEIRLAATYSPAGETAIVALHGAAKGTRDHFLYEHLHEVLLSAGGDRQVLVASQYLRRLSLVS